MLQPAATQGRVTQVAAISGKDFIWIFAPVKIEDIVMCADGSAAWLVGIGPGPFDDMLLFKLTGVNTDSPRVDPESFIEYPDAFLGGNFPAGMGPRGFPGMSVDITCSFAYIPNFFLDSVVKVDLQAKEIVWPAGYNAETAEDLRTITAPVDAQLNSPADNRVLVSSADGALYTLDAATGEPLSVVETGGIGPGSVVAAGSSYAFVVQNSRDLACVDQRSGKVTTIGGLGTNPFMAVASSDKTTLYVSNQGSNTVTVLSGLGCNKSVVAEIAVGNAPRHLALSPDDRYLYVSNSLDNTVSVIDTRTLSVVETIDVTGRGEPAPVGVVAVSMNNRYLYVFWEGGPRGTPGTFQIYVYDVSGLYATR
jgi:YVTN family beta-propeller protein